MYAITGITGNVGGELARNLLSQGRPVRAVLRDEAKAAEWVARGCEIALARMENGGELAAAFTGAEAVFILPPNEFDPQPGYPEARRVIDAVVAGLAAKPRKILCLSTIGADAPHDNLLSQRTLMEQALAVSGIPTTFLRPAWFMENALWDVAAAREEGVLRSFLTRAVPMVATRDIGRLACELIQQEWTGNRIVELEGPAQISANDLAQAFSTALHKSIRLETVPRGEWQGLFLAQGMRNPLPRMRMLDGFNEGWIGFRGQPVKGATTLSEVIAGLVA